MRRVLICIEGTGQGDAIALAGAGRSACFSAAEGRELVNNGATGIVYIRASNGRVGRAGDCN